jgi:hypothetical protein
VSRAVRTSLGLLLASVGAAAAGTFGQGLERRSERGPVIAVIRVAPSELRLGDPFTLELEVRAEPGVELLMPEFGEALDRFAILEFIPSEGLDEEGATIARQRYTLQTSRSGPQSIPPLLIEFVDRRDGRPATPRDEDAYELLTERLEFEVEAVLPEDAPLELRASLGELSPLASPGALPWPMLLAGAALLAVLAPFAVRAWQRHRAGSQPRSAYAIARAELDALLAGPRPRPERMDPFYVKLSAIVRRYLEERFGLRSPELTTEEFLAVLTTSPELSRVHRQLLKHFLEQADLVKFARHVPGGAEVQDSIRAAQCFLHETRDDQPPSPASGSPPTHTSGSGTARA